MILLPGTLLKEKKAAWDRVAFYVPFTLSTALIGDCSSISRRFRRSRHIGSNSTACRCLLWSTPASPLSLSLRISLDLALQLPDTLLQRLVFLLDLLQLCLVLRHFLVAWGAQDAGAAVVARLVLLLLLARVAGGWLGRDGVSVGEVAGRHAATRDARGAAVAARRRGVHWSR